ncbi:hypothetical protein AB1740_003023 [Vibrio fluvialis]
MKFQPHLWCLVLAVMAMPVLSATLETLHYVVEVTSQCEEGNVSCDNVTYVGHAKESGKLIALKGETLHMMCKDGKTPCRFLGYHFFNGNTEYQVLENGILRVVQDSKVILEERGQWKH